ncbi:armadillo-type protein [Mycena sanguinolenta]|nr:armadillo-type protein [Mycena sanguinolenta]
MVLRRLDRELRRHKPTRQVVVDDTVGLQLVVELLESPFPRVRFLTCSILGRLAGHESTMATALCNFDDKLVPLLRDEDEKVVEKAMWAFSAAVRYPGGAQAFVDGKLLDSVPELLESPRPFVRTQSCRLVGMLASRRKTIAAVLESRFCPRLVVLLRNEDIYVIHAAVYALTQISRTFSGARAVVNAKTLDHVPQLLNSKTMVQDRCYELLEILFRNGCAVPEILRLNICPRLVSILESAKLPPYPYKFHETDSTRLTVATSLLAEMSEWPGGVSAAAETGVLDAIQRIECDLVLPLDDRVRSDMRRIQDNIVQYKDRIATASVWVRRLTYMILGYLVVDESTASTALTHFGIELVPLVRDEDDKAFIDAKFLDSVPELLESSRPSVRTQACRLVGKLASHAQTTTAVLKSKPCPRLVVLLRDKDIYVVHAALYALTQISRTFPGAKAVLNAKALQHVPELLDPETMVRELSYASDKLPHPQTNMVQERCYELLESLFRREFAVPAILRLNIYTRLVSILQSAKLPPFPYNFHEIDTTMLTVATALLARMTGWPAGVSAVAETAVLDAIEWIDCELALPLDARVRADMRTIQDNVARYKDRNHQYGISG